MAVKSQIHDGFATIRHRGRFRRNVGIPETNPESEKSFTKTYSGDLTKSVIFENNNELGYEERTDNVNLSANNYVNDRSEVNYGRGGCENGAKTLPHRRSLNYRNSFTFTNRTIYENDATTLASDEINSNLFQRNYATIGHVKARNVPNSNVKYSTLNQNYRRNTVYGNHSYQNGSGNINRNGGYFEESCAVLTNENELDYKIGCQTILRAKPQIPWYDLALKKSRHTSCPAIEAHVVSAFEQSLSNMTQRLQQLTVTAERKDSELTEMRQTIELLRKQSIQAGLTSAHIRSMGVASPASTNGQGGVKPTSPQNPLDTTSSSRDSCMTRHHSTDSMSSLNSLSSNCSMQDKKKKKGWLRSSFTKAFSRNAKVSKTSRQVGTGADSTLEGGHSDGQGLVQSTPPRSPQKVPHSPISAPLNNITESRTEGNGSANEDQVSEEVQLVVDLKKQLREKDLVLTDIRLEALTSAHQLESLKDTVMKMRTEMLNLKQNNERLQRLVTSRSLAGSEVSLGGSIISVGDPRRCSMSDGGPARPPMDLPRNLSETDEDLLNQADPPEPAEGSRSSPESLERLSPREQPIPEEFTNNADNADATDGKKIAISVYLGQPESFLRYFEEVSGTYKRYITDNHLIESSLDNHFYKNQTVNYNEFVIAHTYISGKTTWQNLDYIVRKTFKDYLSKIDPGTNLGLNTDSITSYHLGEAKRGPEMGLPELLPCGYIIGNVKSLYICLQGVGSLAFDSLIPRSIVNRYISLLSEHRRLILCGPGGTGKSYLARRLAEFLVARAGHMHPNEAIATFNVDPKSSKELRQYLSHVAEQGMAGAADDLPAVIILDDLHHASALGEVFSCLLSAGPSRLPCIIGTMSQATCNTTNLQLHHNFRWVLTANHMEPVKGFLARYLRRRLFSLELQTGSPQGPLDAVLSWLPAVWTHVNRFLEAHSSSDVTIGPRLFLQCPLDLKSSQVWFTDVWNYSLAPYLVEAVREGVQLYGRRGGPWTDPSAFLRESYPWQGGPGGASPLRHVTAEDVGMEPGPGIQDSNGDSQDPLLSMLMRLQEAANYSNDSDCASLDSNLTHDSSAGAD